MMKKLRDIAMTAVLAGSLLANGCATQNMLVPSLDVRDSLSVSFSQENSEVPALEISNGKDNYSEGSAFSEEELQEAFEDIEALLEKEPVIRTEEDVHTYFGYVGETPYEYQEITTKTYSDEELVKEDISTYRKATEHKPRVLLESQIACREDNVITSKYQKYGNSNYDSSTYLAIEVERILTLNDEEEWIKEVETENWYNKWSQIYHRDITTTTKNEDGSITTHEEVTTRNQWGNDISSEITQNVKREGDVKIIHIITRDDNDNPIETTRRENGYGYEETEVKTLEHQIITTKTVFDQDTGAKTVNRRTEIPDNAYHYALKETTQEYYPCSPIIHKSVDFQLSRYGNSDETVIYNNFEGEKEIKITTNFRIKNNEDGQEEREAVFIEETHFEPGSGIPRKKIVYVMDDATKLYAVTETIYDDDKELRAISHDPQEMETYTVTDFEYAGNSLFEHTRTREDYVKGNLVLEERAIYNSKGKIVKVDLRVLGSKETPQQITAWKCDHVAIYAVHHNARQVTEAEYNDLGRLTKLVSETDIREDGKIDSRFSLLCDAEGKILSKTSENLVPGVKGLVKTDEVIYTYTPLEKGYNIVMAQNSDLNNDGVVDWKSTDSWRSENFHFGSHTSGYFVIPMFYLRSSALQVRSEENDSNCDGRIDHKVYAEYDVMGREIYCSREELLPGVEGLVHTEAVLFLYQPISSTEYRRVAFLAQDTDGNGVIDYNVIRITHHNINNQMYVDSEIGASTSRQFHLGELQEQIEKTDDDEDGVFELVSD